MKELIFKMIKVFRETLVMWVTNIGMHAEILCCT